MPEKFFIDTDTGRVATIHQLIAAGVTAPSTDPPRPWFGIRGSGEVTTLWHAVMRKPQRGIYLGTVVMRHSDHHERLLADGWEDVPISEIGVPEGSGPRHSM